MIRRAPVAAAELTCSARRCHAPGRYEVIRRDLGWYACDRHLARFVGAACQPGVVIQVRLAQPPEDA